jgi:ABC-type nitrate/sulfonate/bicarbonate transport system permease component
LKQSKIDGPRAPTGAGFPASSTPAEDIPVKPERAASRAPRRFYWVGTFGVVIAAWYLATAREFINPILLPSPLDVGDTFSEMALSGELFRHIGVSLRRITIGFALGFITAVPFGLLIARVRLVRNIVEPILETIRPVPALAFLPLAILWFGIGEESKIFLLWFGSFFVIIISVIEGVYNFDVMLLRAAQNLDAKEYQIFWYVLLPGILPFILQGVRQAIADAFRVIVAAEMIAAEVGIGFLILHSSIFYRSDRVFVGIITLGVLGMLVDKLVSYAIQNYFLRYRQHGEVSI